ncbi:MAG: MoxR family ATPase [Anaerolineae bacterium]|nr:MoxR family ATPase [Anaerolineae bacterium]
MTEATAIEQIDEVEFRDSANAILSEVRKVIVGQEDVVQQVLMCVIAGGHALLEGVPGLGKTMLIRTLSDVLDLKFSRIQFTPDLMPADIVGTNIMEESEDGRRHFRFEAGPVFANLVLADEVNRATPKTQSALLEAMQEKSVTVANQRYILDPPFFVLATQNPLEMEGTYPLPEAQLDRFLFKIDVLFPSTDELIQIMARTTGTDVPRAQPVVDGARIVAMGELTREVPVPTHVQEYIAQLVKATHPGEDAPPGSTVNQFVRYGASPRGAQALVLGIKVRALLEGRRNIAFEDVEAVAHAALRHRILLNFDALAEGIAPDDIISDLLMRVPKNVER